MRTKLRQVAVSIMRASRPWDEAPSASAHHVVFAAEFDAKTSIGEFQEDDLEDGMDQSRTLWLRVLVKQPDGTAINWAIEAGTPNVPVPARIHVKDTLTPGTEVVIDGYQAKRRLEPRQRQGPTTLPDGRQLFLRLLRRDRHGLPTSSSPGLNKQEASAA